MLGMSSADLPSPSLIDVNRRLRALTKIYREMNTWSKDDDCVPRVVAAVNPMANVAVVGEAYGRNTVRHSGVNYFRVDGRLGATGQNLEEILSSAGLTLYPAKNVRLRSGALIEAVRGEGRQTVYCSDICPEYPGYRQSMRNFSLGTHPSSERVQGALGRKFLVRELKIVQPKRILLLGATAYKVFYRYILRKNQLASLQTVMRELPGHLAQYGDAVLVPFWHPSPANPKIRKYIKELRHDPSDFVRCILQATPTAPPS